MHIDQRECRDTHGNSPLMAAVRANNFDVVKYFVEKWNWKVACGLRRWSEMHEACYRGNIKLLEYFTSRNITLCGRSLTEAAAYGDQTEVLKYLMDHGYGFRLHKELELYARSKLSRSFERSQVLQRICRQKHVQCVC